MLYFVAKIQFLTHLPINSPLVSSHTRCHACTRWFSKRVCNSLFTATVICQIRELRRNIQRNGKIRIDLIDLYNEIPAPKTSSVINASISCHKRWCFQQGLWNWLWFCSISACFANRGVQMCGSAAGCSLSRRVRCRLLPGNHNQTLQAGGGKILSCSLCTGVGLHGARAVLQTGVAAAQTFSPLVKGKIRSAAFSRRTKQVFQILFNSLLDHL